MSEIDHATLQAAIAEATTVFVAGGMAYPATLVEWLNRHPELTSGKQWVFAQPAGFGQPSLRAPGGRIKVFFRLGSMAEAEEIELVPMQYRAIADWLSEPGRVDLVLAQIAPHSAALHSLGLGVDFLPAALQGGRPFLAELNHGLPAPQGSPTLPVERVRVVCESVVAPWLGTVGSKAGADAEDDPVRRIGALVADMVEDGDCLQLGIGAIPDAVLASVSSRRDLGVHSGMISDGVLDLIRQGAITGARKTIDRHHVVTGFLLGSAELYAWARQAPQLRLRPVSYTHDAGVLARLDRLVSINSAVEIDLLGQVNSERLGGRAISGVGGQIDFLRAASVSRGGRSILALPSTARGGQVSRIVGHIPAAAVVTTCRTDVDLVVTEWGVASLRGATERERAERLIEVAAPEFREQLRATLEAS